MYDVVIIGAGVVGSAVARELSRYRLSIAVLEKNLDVCTETSGRNSAVVHGGFAYDPGTLKAKLCVEGNQMMDQLSEELDFPFERCGKVLVGNTEEDRLSLERTYKQGLVIGAPGLELIDEEKLHELVPAVIGKYAMWSKNSGILDPFLFTVALAENAHANGAEFFFDHKVTGITRPVNADDPYVVHTAHGDFTTRWVVNAAGLGCKEISDMLGLPDFKIIGSKCNYIVLDKKLGPLLPMPVYPVPNNFYMGIHVTNTTDGNVTVGPDAEATHVLDYYGVPQDKIDALEENGNRLWPHIRKADQIRNYCGILPKWINDEGVIQDFKIEILDDIAPRAVNLFGMESPALTAAGAIGKYVVELMQQRETFEADPDFNPIRKGIRKFSKMTKEEQTKAIAENPDYGELFCRCEKVTKAEMIQAIHNPLGVHTMSGIKFRTRAMMGTCQGGFCQMKLEQLLESELGIQPENIVHSRQGSWVLTGAMREEDAE